MEIGKRLGAENYVFWGGREGYENLWVTDMKREQEHMAKFFHMCADYAGAELGEELERVVHLGERVVHRVGVLAVPRALGGAIAEGVGERRVEGVAVRRRLRLCRGAAQALPRDRQAPGRRELRVLGRPRRGDADLVLVGVACEVGVVAFEVELEDVDQVVGTQEIACRGRVEVVLVRRRFLGLSTRSKRTCNPPA